MATKNPNAQALGALGGKRRSERLTADERKAAAKLAAAVRWKKCDLCGTRLKRSKSYICCPQCGWKHFAERSKVTQ